MYWVSLSSLVLETTPFNIIFERDDECFAMDYGNQQQQQQQQFVMKDDSNDQNPSAMGGHYLDDEEEGGSR